MDSVMNESWISFSNRTYHFTSHWADRLLAVYSLLLIVIGTPANLLCCCIYFQRSNRNNAIKMIFAYLALLDTIVLYTFNLNYVVREFHLRYPKKNLEEYSLIICRGLSYIAFSTLQSSSWILVLGSLNRYLLIKKYSQFEFICKRHNTLRLCFSVSCLFFMANIHIVWMNGYRSEGTGKIICYQNKYSMNYMVWYQRVHLCMYSFLPSVILFLLNSLLIRTIFASKKRLKNHRCSKMDRPTSPTSSHRSHLSSTSWNRSTRQFPRRTLNRHNRKLTLSLIFISLSYFILTFPSTVIFSFFRPYIEPIQLRRTLSLLFTNLSTTTHAIRFFIYFVCSMDFRNDFSHLFSFQPVSRWPKRRHRHRQQEPTRQTSERPIDSITYLDKHLTTG